MSTELSSERATRIQNEKSAINWCEGEKLADQQRQAFLDRLKVQSSLSREKGKIWLGDWLYYWVEDRVTSPRPLTDSDRTFIDKLRSQHQHKLS